MTLSAGHLLRKTLLLKFERLIIPLTPLGLILSFVAALLTLRTNNALTRLFTGRAAWGRLLSLTRDTAQVLATYVYPVDPQMGLLCARHLAIVGWLTKTRFREENDEDITSAALSKDDAFFVQSQRKKAPACIMRIRQAVAHLSKKVGSSAMSPLSSVSLKVQTDFKATSTESYVMNHVCFCLPFRVTLGILLS